MLVTQVQPSSTRPHLSSIALAPSHSPLIARSNLVTSAQSIAVPPTPTQIVKGKPGATDE
jgi:hypothetical protein